MKKISVIIILVIIFTFLLYDKSLAGNTRIVVNVSIGTGVVIGAVGIFIHLSYSSRADLLKKERQRSLVLFPDTGSFSLYLSDQSALNNDITDESIRAYIVGIRW
ncbi:MAG: hypothetical protein HZA13_07440 [Nitrospirae bacterium]|nr:hypothetical protein [Nitrospirota bacterium]